MRCQWKEGPDFGQPGKLASPRPVSPSACRLCVPGGSGNARAIWRRSRRGMDVQLPPGDNGGLTLVSHHATLRSPSPARRPLRAPPALRRGDRAYCHVRGCEVVRTAGATVASRGRAAGGWAAAAAPACLDEALAFAVGQGAAVAVKHWFGVGVHAVLNWRKALTVKRMASWNSVAALAADGTGPLNSGSGDGVDPERCCTFLNASTAQISGRTRSGRAIAD